MDDDEHRLERTNTTLCAVVNGMIAEGHRPSDVASVALAYALQMMIATHGQIDVCVHLAQLALGLFPDSASGGQAEECADA